MKKKKECIISFMLAVSCLLSACGSVTADKKELWQEESAQEIDQPEIVDENDKYAGALCITEIMAKNGAVIQCPDGNFYDWVEVENVSSEQIPLEGWSLVKNEKEYSILNGSVLQPGEFAVVFASGETALNAIHAECRIAPGDFVSLSSPGGTRTPAVECFEDAKNVSIALNSDGVFVSSVYSTPGIANTLEGYDRLSSERSIAGPLVINEAMGKNAHTVKCGSGYEDWIELKNVSSSNLNLSDYFLSDKSSDPFLFRLPERNLAPGEIVIIWCSGDDGEDHARDIHSNFKISGSGESIFLSNDSGYVDYLAFPNLPTDWSVGREEGQNGWFIYQDPTPGCNNSGGFRRMSEEPSVLTQPGCYDGVESVSVELSGRGIIHYTTDGSVPNGSSPIYSGPITVRETTVIRCFEQEDGLAPGNERVLTYFINEGHTLPVLSLVADDLSSFKGMYYLSSPKIKSTAEIPGNLSFYDNGEVFSQKCSISMKGWTSLSLPKKSLGVRFTGNYGDGPLKCELFGKGQDEYSSLSIRAGQDYTTAVIRNELIQELCIETGNNVPTQHSKYCALYLNGKYWGLYCLKEDITKSFYANLKGVDKSEVVKNKSPALGGTPLYEEVITYCLSHDMSEKENYDHFCSVFDVENLIDWTIFEGFSANTDINGNMRYFRTEKGKWQIVLYDVDWSLKSSVNGRNPFLNILVDPRLQVFSCILDELMENEEFCNSLYSRAEELFDTVLSNEHVLKKIDELAAEVEPEIARDREKWDLSAEGWSRNINSVREYITYYNWDESCLTALHEILDIND